MSLSNRSNPKVIQRFADDFGYEAVTFTSLGLDNQPIYHTNVMMCVGSEFAMVGLAMIPNKLERQQVRARLEASGKEIVELAPEQVANFAGNAIELHDSTGAKLLVLSSRALRTLDQEQRTVLSRHARLVPLELPTIELAGGSARCMIATIHLPTSLTRLRSGEHGLPACRYSSAPLRRTVMRFVRRIMAPRCGRLTRVLQATSLCSPECKRARLPGGSFAPLPSYSHSIVLGGLLEMS